MLATSRDERADKRVERLETVFAAAERLGAVITIREMLMVIAFVTTGGLACEDVHKMRRRRKYGWQNRYAFYNLLFQLPPNLNPERLKRIPALSYLRRLDPGTRAQRQIDEQLINELGVFSSNQLDLLFASQGQSGKLLDAAEGIDGIIGNPRSKNERQVEADLSNEVVRSLRRRAYFDEISKES